MEKFKNDSNAFNFSFERTLKANEKVILQMPVVSPNKRGINDIGWLTDGSVTIYGTLSSDPENTTLWQEIKDSDDVNKTVSALKIVNGSSACSIAIRVILN